MAINGIVQNRGGSLPDILLLTQAQLLYGVIDGTIIIVYPGVLFSFDASIIYILLIEFSHNNKLM